jgi:hypothetical protein
MCQAVLPYMRKERKGKIINLSSIGGVMGLPYQGFYSASKFAIEGFTEALSAEVRGFGIKVSMVEPGDFATGFTASRRNSQATLDDPDYGPLFRRSLAIIEKEENSGLKPDVLARRIARIVEQKTGQKPLCVSVMTGDGLQELRDEIVSRFSEVFGGYAVKGELVGEGERVLLVIPREVRTAAAKELLPHFKVFCELLSRKCLVLSCVPEMLPDVLEHLTEPPKLIITDVEYLDKVRELKPSESMLTSYSVLREDCGAEAEKQE